MLKHIVVVAILLVFIFNSILCQTKDNVKRSRPCRCETTKRISSTADICGISSQIDTLVPFIIDGEDTIKGDWPWLVALFIKKTINLKLNTVKFNFICGGSLISQDKVLTAAHCVVVDSQIRPKEELLLKFGGYNLNDWTEETQSRSVESIIVRSDYGPMALQNDISIITLTKKIIYNDYIRPVCMWTSSDDQDFLDEKDATVVGWGLDENNYLLLEQPKRVKMPIITNDQCKSSNIKFYNFISNTTLCAGGGDGSGPCKGDSGGGLYVKIQNRWYIRGIVSQALPGKEKIICDLNQYVIFTDVTEYKLWIANPVVDNELIDRKSEVYSSIMESKSICGVREDIPNADGIYRGKWPWLAAVYNNAPIFGFKAHCAGTIISNKVVLTAAFCIRNNEGSTFSASELFVRVGIYKLNDWADSSTQTISVKKIVTHENFSRNIYLENNIAILKLGRVIKFDGFVKPVCLWNGNADRELVYEKTGEVIGWDDLNNVTLIGMEEFSVPIVSTEKCNASNARLSELVSEASLCAGLRDGVTGPCDRGYIGGGLFVKQNDKWTVRALYSWSPARMSRCAHSEYQVYTDVAQFKSWIEHV